MDLTTGGPIRSYGMKRALACAVRGDGGVEETDLGLVALLSLGLNFLEAWTF